MNLLLTTTRCREQADTDGLRIASAEWDGDGDYSTTMFLAMSREMPPVGMSTLNAILKQAWMQAYKDMQRNIFLDLFGKRK